MAYPVEATRADAWPANSAAPSPTYTGTFIPEIWSGKLIEKFYDTTVLTAISNTNYEGEIKGYGDKVVIRTRPSITINAYSAEQALTFERPASATIDLLIDKGYYFNTILDDVMETQSDINMMNLWSTEAAEQMKIQIDTEVLAYVPGAASTADNSGATAGRVSGAIDLGVLTATNVLEVVPDGAAAGEINVIDLIVDLGTVLDEENIPQDRFLVIPTWMSAMIKKSELRDASIAGDGTSMLRNGRIGMVDRFELYVSNLLPTGSNPDAFGTDPHYLIAGHKNGLTFASQMTKNETLRAESTFGEIMRGLQVYGRQVIDTKALAISVARPSGI